MKKILWISPIIPFPINAGNRKHLAEVINVFKQGYEIDFVLYGWEKEANKNINELKSLFNSFVNIAQPVEKIMSKDGFWGIDDWVSYELVEKVKILSASKVYDIAVSEYVWTSKVLEFLPENVVKIINTHDIFTDRDHLLEKQGIEKQWFYTREIEEARGLSRADLILGITETDCIFYREILKNINADSKVINLSTGIECVDRVAKRKFNLKDITVGYLASSNAMNKESINRFFKEFYKHKSAHKLVNFDIGGAIAPYIEDYPGLRIYKKGYFKKIEDFYAQVDFVIAPMVEGTGLKIKCVEAVAHGVPLIATRYATNDMPVKSVWHKFPSIEVMAKYFSDWVIKEDLESRKGITLSYLESESLLLKKHFSEVCFEQRSQLFKEIQTIQNNKSLAQVSEIKTSLQGGIHKRFSYEKTVSVIIAAYNSQEYIAKCLDSIVNDKLENFEVIVINDGSNDETLRILNKYAEQYTFIHVLSQENQGQGPARNAGINISKGEYLYFVDSDDYLGENSLHYLYEFSKNNKLDICSPDRPYLNSRPLEYISALPGWCCFIRSELIKNSKVNIRQPAIRSGQDGVFSNMVLTQCKTSGVCHSAKYIYVQRDDSTFNSLKKDVSIVPGLVEKHLNSLRGFYAQNELGKTQAARYTLFLQDETYKWRFKKIIKLLNAGDAERIFLMIKAELKWAIKYCGPDVFKYLESDFLSVLDQNYSDHVVQNG